MTRKSRLGRSAHLAYPATAGVVALAVLLLWAAGFVFLKARHDESAAQHLLRQSETQRVAWQAVTQMHQVGMEAYFQNYIMQPRVLQLLHRAQNATEAEKNRIRAELLTLLQDAYSTLQKRGVRQLQFHTPQTRSFLRFHQPERYGDSLLAERPLVAKANRELLPTHGFETGRVISGFRNIFPILDEGVHLGTVELSQPFEFLRRELARVSPNREYLLVLNAQSVLSKIFEENRDFYATSCLGDGWLIEDPKREWPDAPPAVSAESMMLGKQLMSRPENARVLTEGRAVSLPVRSGGRTHYVTLSPIFDVTGELNAYLVSFAGAPELDGLDATLKQQSILLGLFLALFGWLLYRFVSGRHELQALNRDLADRVKREVTLRLKEVERLSHEKELQQALLIQQSKQAEMGGMIGAIAHQWKQPLNTISVMTQTLMDVYEDGDLSRDKLAGHIREVMKQIGFMTDTINDFRSFYKPSRKKEAFSVRRAVQSVLDLLRIQLDRHNTQITLEGDEFIQAEGYPSEFKQVILNLISNAKEAAKEHDGGLCKIDIRIRKEGHLVRIGVTDNGGGIAPELLPDKLFEPFRSTKGEEGTGVGLSLSKTIIEEKMSGRLYARNVEGGAEFTIELPAA
ncbi:MAG: ATP-binding protein [Campylobacterales bacterium]